MVRLAAAVILVIPTGFAGCLPWWTTPAQLSVDAAALAAEERKVGEAADDFSLKASIIKALTVKGLVWIRADVYQGEVLLTGAVKTEDDEKEALALAQAVPGVRLVFDEIQVAEDASLKDTARDYGLEYKVQAALTGRLMYRVVNYRWRCVNGIAYLIGMAKDRDELEDALDAVLGVDGVEDVVEHVKIKPPPDDQHDLGKETPAKAVHHDLPLGGASPASPLPNPR